MIFPPSGHYATIPASLSHVLIPLQFSTDPYLQLSPALFKNAVEEVARNNQVPLGLALSMALASLALAQQSLIDVKIPVTGAIRPVTLTVITIAESGERKSTCYRQLTEFIRDIEECEKPRYAARLLTYMQEKKAWTSDGKLLDKKRQKAVQAEVPVDEINLQIKAHLTNEPMTPIERRIQFENASLASILQTIAAQNPSFIVSSDEASILINGPVLDQLPTLNKLTDGDCIFVDRKNSVRIAIENPRLTIALSLQMQPFEAFIRRNNSEAIENGFINRALISQPASLQGSRILDGSAVSWEHLPKLMNMLKGFLEQSFTEADEPVLNRTILEMSASAQEHWLAYYNWVESNCQQGHKYAHCKGHASKLAENVARLAALFQGLEGGGPISEQMTDAAIAIVNWYSTEFLRVVMPPPSTGSQLTQSQLDANEINSKLFDRLRGMNIRFVCTAEAKRFAPNALRKDKRAHNAIVQLLEDGFLSELHDGQHAFIDLFNHAPHCPSHWYSRILNIKFTTIPNRGFKTPNPYSAFTFQPKYST